MGILHETNLLLLPRLPIPEETTMTGMNGHVTGADDLPRNDEEFVDYEREARLQRKVELKCMAMNDVMEYQGFKAEEIQRKVSIFRQMLLVKEHIAMKMKREAQPIYEENNEEENEEKEEDSKCPANPTEERPENQEDAPEEEEEDEEEEDRRSRSRRGRKKHHRRHRHRRRRHHRKRARSRGSPSPAPRETERSRSPAGAPEVAEARGPARISPKPEVAEAPPPAMSAPFRGERVGAGGGGGVEGFPVGGELQHREDPRAGGGGGGGGGGRQRGRNRKMGGNERFGPRMKGLQQQQTQQQQQQQHHGDGRFMDNFSSRNHRGNPDHHNHHHHHHHHHPIHQQSILGPPPPGLSPINGPMSGGGHMGQGGGRGGAPSLLHQSQAGPYFNANGGVNRSDLTAADRDKIAAALIDDEAELLAREARARAELIEKKRGLRKKPGPGGNAPLLIAGPGAPPGTPVKKGSLVPQGPSAMGGPRGLGPAPILETPNKRRGRSRSRERLAQKRDSPNKGARSRSRSAEGRWRRKASASPPPWRKRRDSPHYLERRRITSARKRPVPYNRKPRSPTPVSSRSSSSSSSRSRSSSPYSTASSYRSKSPDDYGNRARLYHRRQEQQHPQTTPAPATPVRYSNRLPSQLLR